MGDPRPLVVPVLLACTETPRALHLDEVGHMLVAHGIDPTSGRSQSLADRPGLSSDHKLRKYCFMSKLICSEETIDAETLSLLKMLHKANSRDYVQFLFEVEQVVKMLNLLPLQACDLRSLLSNMTFLINHILPLGMDVAKFALNIAYTKDGWPVPPLTPKEFLVKNPGDAIVRMTTLKAYMEVFYPHERCFSKYCDRFVVLALQMTNMDKLVMLELNARHTVLTLGYDWVEVLDCAIMHYVDGLGLKRGWATSSRDLPSSSLSLSGPTKPAKIARTDDAYTPPVECLLWNGNGGKNANHVWADCQNCCPGSISPAAHLALMGGARRSAKQ
ncbi:hypothetical protein AMAG_17614 [Allomyces macrogynus ATCC 38327]|uniref:Uncharacterized protein n=1 Tax=Allomyces macrogynus (strain ATCC 38327) TaxID=578462 RepID=A0A0L0RUW7_ALLM3|nr:hypothetical protein AMAG_17614 [Allomyces macrogynus ATCC 38327]|eukprot:KNE54058.1 hypothetical protein AMAG_17614 [Allomyces macrogynus ATCC 38327]